MKKLIYITILAAIIAACSSPQQEQQQPKQGKIVVYQVFTRLFGNTNTNNKPWGTIEENGVGKFNDFTDKALSEIKRPRRFTYLVYGRSTSCYLYRLYCLWHFQRRPGCG